ncbi:MAG TPA: 2,3,4,5-tetrahydropyridine-2,6-dicarboxylate N-succinyltransferase [Xanthomonadaceae bacterium]|nr:2,3,4,5-tetrahydropyridine-2,6-dicarboxylate N-succinyltransferase [Xanthomonadaceae bacterium]
MQGSVTLLPRNHGEHDDVTPDELQSVIEEAFEKRAEWSVEALREHAVSAVELALDLLESGEARVAEPDGRGDWRVNQWLKKAVLLSFRLHANRLMPGQPAPFYDKVPLRYEDFSEQQFAEAGARIVPGAIVRRGAHVGRDVVLMPSFVNIGAHVGASTMVDTWATVGSCAQIGRNVHLSGGAGIGGVLEPLQAAPTIIEDDCFIGARSEVVEGVIVERGAVIGMGVFLGQSTRIYDRASGTIHQGRVPAGSVVVPGALPSADGRYSLACAVIVKQVDEKTRSKVGVNELLRMAAEEGQRA